MTTLNEPARIELPGGEELRVSRWTMDGAPGGVLLPATALPEFRAPLADVGEGVQS